MMFASALVDSFRDGSLRASAGRNMLAGITVGVVALPLSMGLAIASGVPPQHGLYTAIIGGLFIALSGGSRVNISGPTAAFVVVLLPVVQQFGLGGLLLSGALAGLIMIAFGLLRLGRFIQAVPYPVVIGFTAGIGTVIAFMQIKDLLGLLPEDNPVHFAEKAWSYIRAIPTLQWQEALIGFTSLGLLFGWKRLNSKIPGYLIALIGGTLLAVLFNQASSLPGVETIGTRFHYTLNGVSGSGIPSLLPQMTMPWLQAGADGQPIGLSFGLLQTLMHAAFAIAVLGALESLLCATVADGMTGQQHNPDAELIGQGMGNLVVPFFGGIPVTAAIARTALNVRSGGSTPLAAITHALFVLLAMVLLAPMLSLIPMSAMAAVLIGVAWNMSEMKHVVHLVRNAPRSDVAVFVTCYSLTVLVDMQIAVSAGLVMAALIFIRRMSEMSNVSLLADAPEHNSTVQIPGVVMYRMSGPLFFGAAHKALKVILAVDRNVKTVVLDMSDVSMLDSTAMINLRSISGLLVSRNTSLYLIHVPERMVIKMKRFGLFEGREGIRHINDMSELPVPG